MCKARLSPAPAFFSSGAPFFWDFNGNFCRLIEVQVSSLETLSRTLPEVHPAMHHRRTGSAPAVSLATVGLVHVLVDGCAV